MPTEDPENDSVETRVAHPAPPDLPDNPSGSYSPRASVMPFAEWGFAAASRKPAAPLSMSDVDWPDEQQTVGPPLSPKAPPPSFVSSIASPDLPPAAPSAPADPGATNGFSMLRMLGRGGMGEVWEAIQRSLWRLVAVKRLRPDASGSMASLADEAGRAFHGEAMTSALLDHPNIVPVYDLGVDEKGAPLLAMKYVRGQSWDQAIAADFGTLSPEEHLARHLPILAQVAQAVAFAHSKGVVHRDLKASQVMIGEYGEVLLMDWGLAMMVGAPPQFPGESAPPRTYPSIDSAPCPAGTPGCMAPEQTSPDPHTLGSWTDVYLLGGILFNIMTNMMPHPGVTGTEAFSNASLGMLRSFEEAAPGRAQPAELRELALFALRHTPVERPSARQFLEFLQDYITGAGRRRESLSLTSQLAGEGPPSTYAGFVDGLTKLGQAQLLWPQNPEFRRLRERLGAAYAALALEKGDLTLAQAQAERLTDATTKDRLFGRIAAATERARIQRRRLRQFAVAVLVLGTLVIVGGAIFTFGLQRANKRTQEQLTITETAKEAEGRAANRAQEEFARASLLLADSLVGQGRKDEAVVALLRIPEADRFWEWSYVMTRALEDLWTVPFVYLAWSPSKNMAIGWDIDGGLCALRAESGEVLHRHPREGTAEPETLLAVWSQDEKRVLVATEDAEHRVVFDTATWEAVASLDDLTTATLTAADFSPDGSQVAVGSADGSVYVVEVASGAVRSLLPHKRRLSGIYWGREKLVTLSSDVALRHDLDTGEAETLFEAAGIEMFYRPFRVAADHRRDYFAFAYSHAPTLYGRVDGGPLGRVAAETVHLMITNTRPWVVVSSRSQFPQYTIWDMEKHGHVERMPFKQHEVDAPFQRGSKGKPINAVQVSAEESLALVHFDEMARLHTFPDLHELGFSGDIWFQGARNVVLAPHGRFAWIVKDDGKTHIRPLDSQYVGTKIPGDVSVFGPNDAYTLAINLRWFEQRDVDTGEVIFIGGHIFNLYRGSKTSTDGRHIFLPGHRGDDFVLEKWDRLAGRLVSSTTWPKLQQDFLLHADSSRFAHISDEGTSITMYDVGDGVARRRYDRQLDADGTVVSGQFSSDGKVAVLATTTGHLVVWDAATGNRRRVIRAHHGEILQFTYNTRHDLFQTIGEDRHVRLWEARSLEPVADIAFSFPVAGASVSADRTRLLAWPERGTPILCDLESGRELTRLERSDFPMGNARFVANDTRIVAHQGSAARFWDPATGREVFNMQSGFGEISADSRKFIYKSSSYDGLLIDIAPARAEELGGSGALSYRERLDLWMIERFRRWSRLRTKAAIPPAVDELLLAVGTVSQTRRVRNVTAALSAQAGNGSYARPEARDLFLTAASRIAMTLPDLLEVNVFDQTVHMYAYAIMDRPPFPDSVHASSIVANGTAAARGLEAQGRFQDTFQVDSCTTALENMAIIFQWRGERERAIAVARRTWALRMTSGFIEGRARTVLESLGAEMPPRPPAELVAGPTVGAPPFVLERLGTLRPDITAEERAATEQAAWDAYVAARDAWIDEVAPPLDWEALLAAEKTRPTWQPYPADMTIAELGRQLRADLERILFDGRTLKQAIEDEDRRVDELFAWRREAGAGR